MKIKKNKKNLIFLKNTKKIKRSKNKLSNHFLFAAVISSPPSLFYLQEHEKNFKKKNQTSMACNPIEQF